MKRITLFAAAALLLLGCKQKQETPEPVPEPQGSVVYMTKDISPESLINIYKALGVPAEGRVAVKISTGEAGNNNHLKAELIGPLVKLVNGKIVECNTAYAGKRMNTKDHLKVIEEHGFNTIGGVMFTNAYALLNPDRREAADLVKRMQEDLEYFRRHAMPDPHRTRDAAPDDEEPGQPAEAAE